MTILDHRNGWAERNEHISMLKHSEQTGDRP
jgi:hypothetical protein